MVLTMIIFGEQITYHQQAAFASLTFLHLMKEDDHIVIVTDHPEYYNLFQDRVKTIQINDYQLKEWRGAHDYFWRIKIAAIQHVHQQFPNEDLLYIDTDTFLFGKLAALKSDLEKGNTLMHLRELEISKMKAKTGQVMWKQLKGKSYANILVDKQTTMWNAGVVGLPHAKADKILNQALAICDTMCSEQVRPKLIEQLSLSMALSHDGQLKSAEKHIGHYWGNKLGWNQLIAEFLNKNYLLNQDLDNLIYNIEQIDWNAIPIYIRHSNSKEKALKKIAAFFNSEEDKYLRDML